MTDYLVYWKTFWTYGTSNAKAHVLTRGYGSDARDFSVGDNLWVVAKAQDDPTVWDLRQFIHVVATNNGCAIGNIDSSEFFDPSEYGNFESTLKRLQFHSRTPITNSGAKIGLQLRKPRPLSTEDVRVLDDFIQHRSNHTSHPSLSFPDSEHRKKVEKAAIREATNHLVGLGFEIINREKENCGYDLLATRGVEPTELHVEVKGTSSEVPEFYISRNEKRYMSRAEWRLILVTEALTSPNVKLLTRQEVEVMFLFSPLAWKAEQR